MGCMPIHIGPRCHRVGKRMVCM